MTEKIMQPIFFVELCSQITSRVVFRSYKPIFTFIWMPSKYTQMSLKPNHYLEPCPILLYGSETWTLSKKLEERLNGTLAFL